MFSMFAGLKKTLLHLFHPRHSNNHRPRALHPESLFKLTIIVLLSGVLVQQHIVRPQVFGQVLGFSTTITPDQIIELTNEERQKIGLPPLIYNEILSQAATAKAQDMFADQYWAHTAPDGVEPWDFISEAGYGYSSAGENLARDFFDSSTVMKAWMASPTHKANIIHTKYTDIGVAVVIDSLDGVETALVVQMFGRPKVLGDSQQNSIAAEQQLAEAAASEVIPPAFKTDAPIRKVDASSGALLSPLQITKAILLAVVILLSSTLVYDMYISHHWKLTRMVGKNMAHLMYFAMIAFLLIYFKAGVVG